MRNTSLKRINKMSDQDLAVVYSSVKGSQKHAQKKLKELGIWKNDLKNWYFIEDKVDKFCKSLDKKQKKWFMIYQMSSLHLDLIILEQDRRQPTINEDDKWYNRPIKFRNYLRYFVEGRL